ncbi:MAG: hypothetical protein ACREK6_11030 [Candidatus Rokuibacteriota bacterium]
MDVNDYTLTWLVRQRHAEMLEAAQHRALLARVPPRSGRLRLAVGTVLIRMGAWLLRREYAAG